MVNIFHRKYPNHKKFKTYQDRSIFIDYGIIHQERIDKVNQVTHEPLGYRKSKGDHIGRYLDILETDLF